MISLDTHIVVWLYAGEIARLSTKVYNLIEQNDLLISPVVLLELQYLKEIGRLKSDPGIMLETLTHSIGLKICDLPLIRVVAEAMTQSWTRDPFDRMITAGAVARDIVLVTKDATILTHYPKACWE